MQRQSGEKDRPAPSRLQRWLLASAGVVLVAVGAIGAVVPGLPTVVFLLGASWCFARSCPWLEDRLIRVPFFRPFLIYLDSGAGMPRRVVIRTLVVMWIAIGISSVVVTAGDAPRLGLAMIICLAGVVGTVFVIRLGNRHARASSAGSP